MTSFSALLALTWIAVACGGSRWPTLRVPQVTPASSIGTVVGAVVAWQDGHPIEAATVELRLQADSGVSGASPIVIRTDATGAFFPLVPSTGRVLGRDASSLSAIR